MRFLLIVLLSVFGFSLKAQFPSTYTSSELYHELEKLATVKTVLYMAAHPDDENTRLISYFENELHLRTAYLSLTRGDGGQNLIGTEIGAGIGVLRTQELLGARAIDGGEQFFTRAVDFGYSKSAEESFEKWGRQDVLADVVWSIRTFRPDVIVTRFPPSNYAGHGHHEASAILAEEAFDLAADTNAFPEQLALVEVWQTERLYFNTSSWWIKDLEEQAQNSDDFIRIDVGTPNNLLGETYAQMAARARSQHRSQGFGSDFPYGQQMEYLKYVKGSKVEPGNSLTNGIDKSWSSLGLKDTGDAIAKAINNFDFKVPSKSIETLRSAAEDLSKSKTSFAVQKLEELHSILLKLAGLTVEINTEERYVTQGSAVNARINIVNTSGVKLSVVEASRKDQKWRFEKPLLLNQLFSEEVKLNISKNEDYSNPYWLRAPYETMYAVSDYNLLGKAENDPPLSINLEFDLGGYIFNKAFPANYKMVDPAKAVLFSPCYVVPALAANFSEDVLIAAGKNAKRVFITVTNYSDSVNTTVSLNLPNGWSAEPESQIITLTEKGASALIAFEIAASANAKPGKAVVNFKNAEDLAMQSAMSLQEIVYDHIPSQIILKEAAIELVPIELNTGGVKRVGYIDGPGDDVAKYLSAAGYQVESIPAEVLTSGDLSRYDAIVTGIRAYNTREELKYANTNLNNYVKEGGLWLVQYNTSRGLKFEDFGPYPLGLSRERVTDENALATFLAPDHQVLNTPNKITEADFENWVQERGLYFAGEWDSHFTPIISWHDPEEPPREGGLLVASYGKGNFVYSGISFFRELPAGVPGAYRLLANILALGNKDGSVD